MVQTTGYSLFQENKQRIEQLQPKITELRELMSQMKNAEGVDPQEYSQLRSELNDFDSKMESLNKEISKEEKRYGLDIVWLFADKCLFWLDIVGQWIMSNVLHNDGKYW